MDVYSTTPLVFIRGPSCITLSRAAILDLQDLRIGSSSGPSLHLKVFIVSKPVRSPLGLCSPAKNGCHRISGAPLKIHAISASIRRKDVQKKSSKERKI